MQSFPSFIHRCRESAVCAIETAPSYRPCPSPSASRLAASPSVRAHGSDPAASLSVVRQALEKALLQDNEDFWAENPPDSNAMDQQDPFRRNKLAMQFFLRLHILVACKGVALSPTPCYTDLLALLYAGGCFQSKSCSQCKVVTALLSSQQRETSWSG